MTGRIRTCHAPRFRRALYRTELRSREWLAEPESNGDLLRIEGALPPELSAVDGTWARLDSNQQQLACKTDASAVELLARWSRRSGTRSQPRPTFGASALPVSMRKERRRRPTSPLHPSPQGGDRCTGGLTATWLSLSRPAISRTMFSMPLAYPSTLDRRPPLRFLRRSSSYVEGLWSPKFSGRRKKSMLKRMLIAHG